MPVFCLLPNSEGVSVTSGREKSLPFLSVREHLTEIPFGVSLPRLAPCEFMCSFHDRLQQKEKDHEQTVVSRGNYCHSD